MGVWGGGAWVNVEGRGGEGRGGGVFGPVWASPHLGARGEPLGLRPRVHHFLRVTVARPRLRLDVVKRVEDEDGVRELRRRFGRELVIVEQLDERLDVVAPRHRAEQPHRVLLRDHWRGRIATSDCGEKAGLHICCLVDTRRHALLEQLEKLLRLALSRLLEQLHHLGCLRSVERFGDYAKRCALGDVLRIPLEECRDAPQRRARAARSRRHPRGEPHHQALMAVGKSH